MTTTDSFPKLVHFGNYAVNRVRYIGENRFGYAVWEKDVPARLGFPHGHSTITHFDGFEYWWGQLGSRELPRDIDALPVGDARFAACAQFRRAQIRLAQRIIFLAYPHVRALYDKGLARLDNTLAQIETREVAQ